MTRPIRCTLLLTILVGVAIPAFGTVRDDPVKVTLIRGGDPAPGETPRDILRIEAANAVTLDGLAFEGSNMRLDAPGFPRSINLSAGQVVEFPFTTNSADLSVPVRLRWRRGGVERHKSFDLSLESRRRNVPEPATIYRTMKDARAGLSRSFPGAEIRNPGVELNTSQASNGVIGVSGYVFCEHERSGEQIPAVQVSVRATAMNLIDSPVEVWVNTDETGFFQADIDWNGTYLPDLHLIIKARNASALVQHAIWEGDYTFGTTLYDAEPGHIYALGALSPSGPNTNAAFYIAETLRRGAERLEGLGFPMPFVEVQWPDTGGSAYQSAFDEIHLAPGDGFNEGTILHEFGHHWNQYHARYPSHDYCNGECDDEVEWWFDDCGHCMWCEENATVAWKEGIAQIISRICTDAIEDNYAVPAPDELWAKAIQTHGDPSSCVDTSPDPARTEGPFAALMYDFIDAYDFYEDDQAYPGYRDIMGGKIDEVLAVLSSDPVGACGSRPNTPNSFLACYVATYPSWHEQIWETAMNNGFNIDQEPPGVATHLRGYPVPGTPYPDATIDLDWNTPTDDASGIAGYSLSMHRDSPVDPGTYQDLGDVNAYTTAPMSPGTWYFSIRAVDHAGNWSDDYASLGPFIIEPVVAADLRAADRPGWDFPLVPRNQTGATAASAQVTSVLDGAEDTYWNINGENTGTEVNPSAQVAVYVDDEILGEANFGGIPGGTSRALTDLGPITVDGGRHFTGMFLDSDEVIPEDSETDNYWAGQWAWRPDPLPEFGVSTFSAPPINLAGISYFNFQQPYGPNCRGYRLPARAVLHGVWMYSVTQDSDYDLKLFDLYSGPEDAFLAPIAVSQQGFSKLEALLANGYMAGYQDFDVGVFNNFEEMWGNSDYKIGRMVSQALTAFGTYPDTVRADQMMNLYMFGPLSGTDGYVSLTLSQEGNHPLYMAYFPYDFTTGGILDAEQFRELAQPGHTVLTVQVPTGQNGALAIWQEPVPTIPEEEYTLLYQAALPDPAPYRAPQWASCVVPRPEDDIEWPFTSVPYPTTLPSDPDSTWFYFNEGNFSPLACPLHEMTIFLDGEPFYPLLGPELERFASLGAVGWAPVPVRGGRHSVVMVVDPDEELIEEEEDNNRDGDQWVWEPVPTSWGMSFEEGAPPPATGGWDDMPERPTFLNCLGYETPDLGLVPDRALAAYMIPGGGANYDLRLHPDGTGSQNGFGQHLVNSGYPEGQADFLVFGPITESSPFNYDIGVVNLAGNDDFVLQMEQSDTRTLSGAGTYGTHTLDSGDMLDLHKISMSPGEWTFSLVPARGNLVDLGFSLHAYEATSSRDEAIAQAWEESAPGTEIFSTSLDDPARTYVIAVWRASPVSKDLACTYTLTVEDDVSGVGEDSVPISTRLLHASPNPFPGTTSIAFETAQDGEATLSVFDVRGRRVCLLQEGFVRAGRHLAIWHGKDNRGSPVASGIYFIRLRTKTEQMVMKVVRME